jgi:MYXO-CTERM domain-containing protein
MGRSWWGAVVTLVLVAGRAHGTYSVVAADRETRQVGGAVTSCVGTTNVAFVYGPAVGKGGINAQAAANTAGRDRGVALLGMDVAPADIIAMITAPSFDRSAASRQYGVVDLAGRAAGWTGATAQAYKEDRQGTVGAYTYSVQGNILTSKAVIDGAETAFRTAGCDLAEKLMLALEGGAANGEGDSRCTRAKNLPSDSISIQVDPEGMPAGSYLRLAISGTGTRNPILSMRAMFDDWRRTHPCPGTLTDGGAGTGGAPDAAAEAAAGPGGGGSGGEAGAGGPGAGGGAGAAGGAGAGGGAGAAGGGASDEGGCGCRASGTGASGAVVAAAMVILTAARHRRRRQVGPLPFRG